MLKEETRLMSIKQLDIMPMDLLAQRLRELFAQITTLEASEDNDRFEIKITEDCDASLFMNELDAFVKPYIKLHGSKKHPYHFIIDRGTQLINIIGYNDPFHGYQAKAMIGQEMQQLYVIDVLGDTGYFSVFNRKFENLGEVYMKGSDDYSEGYDQPRSDFRKPELWLGTSEILKSVVKEIIISADEETAKKQPLELDVDNKEDVRTWAVYFDVSVGQLEAAVRNVGPSLVKLGRYFDYLAGE